MISLPSAVGNAIYDATGVDVNDLPLTSERVYMALKEARQSREV